MTAQEARNISIKNEILFEDILIQIKNRCSKGQMYTSVNGYVSEETKELLIHSGYVVEDISNGIIINWK